MSQDHAATWTRRMLLRRAVLGTGGLTLLALAGCQSAPAASPTTAPAATMAPTSKPAVASQPTAVSQPTATGQQGGSFVFVEETEPPTLDIHKTSLSTADVVGGMAVETLVYHNADTGDYEPYLASSWKVSADGLTWTFKLRDDVTFHDGTPFNASAVKQSFDRILDPKTASARAILLLGGKLVKGVDAVDEHTIKLTYTKPFGPLLSGLNTTFCGIMSPAALEKYGDEIGTHPVGTGYFQFKQWTKGQGITLTRYPKYNWAPKAWGRTEPALLDSFQWKGIQEATTRMVALEKGEVQMIRLPWTDFKRAQSSGYQVLQINNPGMPQAIYLNTAKPPLDDKQIRLAIAYAIDRDAIIKAPYLGGAVWAEYAPLTKGVPGYDPNLVKEVGLSFDLNKAKALLDGAGWKPGADGIRQKDGQPLVLKLITTAGGKNNTEVTQLMLKPLGITIQPEMLDSGAWQKAVRSGEHHLTFRADTGSDPDILYLAVHTSAIGTTNYVRAQNKELDDLLQRGRETVDQTERVALYRKAQEIILKEAYIIPIYNSVRVFAMQKNVKGIQFNDRAGVVPYTASLSK